MAKYLLSDDVGLYIDKNASRGWTPFLSALAPGYPNIAGLSKKPETAQLLLSHGANSVVTTHDGWTPLHCLAMHYGSYGTDEEARLIETLVSQDIYCSCRELQYIGDPMTWGKVIRHDLTPLHIAAEFGAIAIARELLKHGANTAAEDSEEKSPAEQQVILIDVIALKIGT